MSRRSFIAAEAFNTHFFSYVMTSNAEGSFWTLVPVPYANAQNCPAGRLLRETGRKLYPDVNPGIISPMVAVYDEVSLLTGFIDANSPIYAVYNTNSSYTTPRGFNPVPVNGEFVPNSAPPVYTDGPLKGTYLAGTCVSIPLYLPQYPLLPYDNTSTDAYVFVNPYLANVFQMNIAQNMTNLTGTIHVFLRDASNGSTDLVPPQGEQISVICINHGNTTPVIHWEPGQQYGFYAPTDVLLLDNSAQAFFFAINGRDAYEITTTSSAGPTGLAGTQGLPGVPGMSSTGATGTTGIQGPQGFQGVQGVPGTQSTTGPTGNTGIQGFQGPQGFQGVSAVDSSTGPTGNTGLQGPQGVQGVP